MHNDQPLQEWSEEFLNRYYQDEIAELVRKYPQDQSTLVIDYSDLVRFESKFADACINEPSVLKSYLEEATRQHVRDLPVEVELGNVDIAITNIEDPRILDVGDVDKTFANEYIGLRGQIGALTAKHPEPLELAFECQRCQTTTYVQQNPQDDGVQEPHECRACERDGPYQRVDDQCEFEMHRLIRLKTPPEVSQGGDPHIDVHLWGDIAEAEFDGDERVVVTGELKIREDNGSWKFELDGDYVEFESGGYDAVDPDEYKDEIQEIAAKDDPIGFLIEEFAPGLHINDELRPMIESIILQLASSPEKPNHRTNFHILFLGDPGTGKSELLERATELAPRSEFAEGDRTSAAALTASAVPDDFGDSEWSLKPGVLVRANDGIVALDEIDKVDESVRESLHGAMQRQRVSVDLADINADLPARVSILAAGNPKFGRFDEYEPIGEQIDMAHSLLSRFDLMYLTRDQPDPDTDIKVAEAALSAWQEGGRQAKQNEDAEREMDRIIRAYFVYARQNVTPVISDDARKKIAEEWNSIRLEGFDEDAPVPVTARKLKAFARLAEASARCRLSETVTEKDVDRATRLILTSLKQTGIDPETGELDADVVETGRTKSQRERVKTVYEAIKELQREYDNGAPEPAIMDRLDIENGKIESELEDLKQKGEIYQPEEDYYMTSG